MVGRAMESLFSLPGHFLVPIVALIMVFGAGIVTTIAKQLRIYFCHRQDIGLKRDLVERGLSVEEIERLIAAGAVDKSSGRC